MAVTYQISAVELHRRRFCDNWTICRRESQGNWTFPPSSRNARIPEFPNSRIPEFPNSRIPEFSDYLQRRLAILLPANLQRFFLNWIELNEKKNCGGRDMDLRLFSRAVSCIETDHQSIKMSPGLRQVRFQQLPAASSSFPAASQQLSAAHNWLLYIK